MIIMNDSCNPWKKNSLNSFFIVQIYRVVKYQLDTAILSNLVEPGENHGVCTICIEPTLALFFQSV